jgi:hypothetical protein
MKTQVLFLAVLAFSSVSLSAQSAKPATPAKAELKKAAEPKIEGITIARPNGTFLGISLEGGTFKLSFYDKQKKKVAPDVPRAAARWNPTQKTGSDRIILNPSADGHSLVGNRPVRPPYVFKLYLTLLQPEPVAGSGSAEQATESYVVDFRA